MEGVGGRINGFEPARCANVNEFVYGPVIAGMWQQHEVWDGTYILDDLLDAHEILSVKSENQYRVNESQKGD